MFVSKKFHESEVKRLQEALALRTEGYESLCRSYEARIEDLQKLVFVPKYDIQPEALEVDAVISGSEKPVEMSEADRTLMLQGAREMDMLISGNYDQDFLN